MNVFIRKIKLHYCNKTRITFDTEGIKLKGMEKIKNREKKPNKNVWFNKDEYKEIDHQKQNVLQNISYGK